MNHRREFLIGTTTAAAATIGAVRWANGQEAERPEKIKADLVGQFVGKSHGDFETVKKLLEQEPALVNATWDWGDGDWESGLGAASHVGRRDIAEYLLEHGARLDAFAATMLGIKPIVEQMLKAFPDIHTVRGPHGICLLSHAIYGKADADPIFEMLLEAGADVNALTKQKSTPLMAAAQVGRVEIVEALLEHGADPEVANVRGETALDLATKREHAKVVALLTNAKKQK